jgi:hypothetical protein
MKINVGSAAWTPADQDVDEPGEPLIEVFA